MKRLILVAAAAFLGGCASQGGPETASAPEDGALRLGAGDELGWRLRARDRAISTVSAEERSLATDQ